MGQSNSASSVINIYSDESHHLRSQGDMMVIGSVWCDDDAKRILTDKITLLKRQHSIAKHREIKWIKVSPAKREYYRSLIDLFFSEEGINFRAVVIPKSTLRHKDFNQTEDDFYYKMQYTMLANIVRKKAGKLRIYLDYKDTWSNKRSQHLIKFLANNPRLNDLTHEFTAQPIRSYESAPMQLADMLIGAVAYANNHPGPGSVKSEIVALIEEYAGQYLTDQSPFGVDKFNILMWKPQ
jgi:hypothetical protein